MNKQILTCPKCKTDILFDADRITKGISFEFHCSCGAKVLYKIPMYTKETIYEMIHSF